jgi:trehalose 6-phosphate synthase
LHIIIASNRGPIVHQAGSDGQITQQKGSGGLITGSSGGLQYIHATWISCAQTPQDRDFKEGDIDLEESNGSIHVKFVDPQPADKGEGVRYLLEIDPPANERLL